MNSFKRNLIIGYTFSLVLLLVSSFASYISINNLLRNSALVNHTNLVINKLEHAISILKDAETGQRGFLLTGEEQFLEPYNGALDIVYNDIRELRELTINNQLQQLSLIKLTDIVENRLKLLQEHINMKKAGIDIPNESLRKGKMYMDDARKQVNAMEQRENLVLAEHTRDANKFAQNSPILIIIAAVLALLVTIISFLRVNADFRKRTALQEQLTQKDREVSNRINIISGIAEKVSGGNYNIKIEEEAKDTLGILAVSLNKMTAALNHSFTLLSRKAWLQTGISELNEKLLGEQTIESAGQNVLEQLCPYTGSNIGAFYCFNGEVLEFIQGYAFLPPPEKKHIQPQEGIAGQALASKKMIVVKNMSHTDLILNYVAGEMRPREIIALPVIFEAHVKAVIVLGTVSTYEDKHREYLETIAENIAIVINTADTRRRLNELLQETQAQAEELTAQHSELEIINTELQAQSEKLKVSEEELKVQQEELLESNSELEERSRLLEERNQRIAEQNRDIEFKAEQLEVTAKYKSEFLANMSHELRTPLNSILLLSRLMADNPGKNLSDEQIEYAKVIQGSGHSLLSLIDEILDLSKIESGKMELDYTTASLKDIVQNMNSLFKPVAADKKLQFDIKIAADTASHIETDVQRLEQVLKNLLSNALKFTATGSVVMIIANAGYNNISFSVTDTGIGIAKDKQQLVFEAFRQEDGSTRRNYGGTGLGLSISRELLKLLGGEITLQSEQGTGSTFKVIIPSKKPELPGIHQPMQPSTVKQASEVINEVKRYTNIAQASIPDDRDKISAGDKIILIIEDDIVFAKALLNFTRESGYKGVVAIRGDEGLDLARQLLPTGILLDIYLPVLDGWEVIESLKSNSRTRHIPVHVMSSAEAKHKSLSAGAVNFINKPVPLEGMQEIFKKIEQVINKTLKKVLIVEENSMHAKALSYFLEANNINTGVMNDINSGIEALQKDDTDCVILDMGVPGKEGYGMLDEIKKTPGLENIPIIVFTGKSLSQAEEMRIKKYADSIVIKTAHSYKRLLDEVSLFLHLVETNLNNSARDSGSVISRRKMEDVLRNKKILIVDDDVRNIYSLSKTMEQHGINVVSAIDGKDALKQLEINKSVQLILMDMMMPELDGYETTRAIRNIPEYKNLPVIAVTAKAMAGDREKCIEAGASDYITKPIDTDQLMSLLRVWLYDKS